MALKDWKLIVDERYATIYKNLKTSNKIEIISYFLNGVLKFRVFISYKTPKTFPTKLKALKFAKEYMEKH